MHSCGGGGSGADGNSILSARQPKAVEGVEGSRWKLWQTKGSSNASCALFAKPGEGVLCVTVTLTRKGELLREPCVFSNRSTDGVE